MKNQENFRLGTVLVCLCGIVAVTPAEAGNCNNKPVLTIDKHTLDFDGHKPVCIKKDESFIIKVKAKGNFDINYADIDVREKVEGAGKIRRGDIDDNGNMTVTVEGYSVGTEPAYRIIVKDIGELDPRVRINGNYLMLNPDFGVIENYLMNEYEMDLAGLLQLDQHLQDQYNTNVAEVLRTIRDDGNSQGN